MPLSVSIFSYNRGEFLQNCIESVWQQAPDSVVTVRDDGSTDPGTLRALDRLRSRCRVWQPQTRRRGRHGALYANMQQALDEARADEIVLMLQDDTQLVRPLEPDDYRYIDDFFHANDRAAFLHPVFLKGARARRDRRITQLAAGFPVYVRCYPEKENQRGLSYADVMLMHAGRLKQVGWRFAEGEVNNAAQAARYFGPMGFMVHPFVMALPQVPVFRHKRKTWAARLAERRVGAAPKVFLPMSPEDVRRLKERDLAQLPVAEQYLRCADPSVKRPFRYSTVRVYPALRLLHHLEYRWRARWRD